MDRRPRKTAGEAFSRLVSDGLALSGYGAEAAGRKAVDDKSGQSLADPQNRTLLPCAVSLRTDKSHPSCRRAAMPTPASLKIRMRPHRAKRCGVANKLLISTLEKYGSWLRRLPLLL
ncbi:hypothetical protein [Hyphococcus luteus]|uniref:hypothetical protein n=1 Tax=Hyphococcus luteus TaxID=2058213 RepID=UPI0010571A09|nr:hypothetical protein [Marinicaulis flavus]